jgi:hypothetical protein
MTFVKKLLYIAVTCLIFFLPLQTRYIFSVGHLGKYASEYQTVSLYGTELLVWIIVLLGLKIYGHDMYQSFVARPRKKKICAGSIVLLVAVSCLGSVNRIVSIYVVYHWVMLMVAGAVVYRVAQEVGYKLWYAISAQGALQAFVGLYQFFTQTLAGSKWLGMSTQLPQTLGVSVIENATGRWLRAYGSFGWPTSLGIFLAVALVVSIALFEKIKNKTERGVMLVCILSMTAGLVVTFARGAWCATAAGLLVLFLVRAHQDADLPVTTRYQRGRDLLAMYFVVGLMAASYVGVLQPIVVTRVQANSFLEQRSVSERVSQYRDAALSIFHHPFFGVGPGAYTSYVFIQYPERDAAGYQPVHSVYALALAELGVPAAVLIAYTILCWLWRRLLSATAEVRYEPEESSALKALYMLVIASASLERVIVSIAAVRSSDFP